MVPYSVKKKNGTRYFYYKCQDTLNCKHAINAEKLDAAVVEEIGKIIADPAYIKECYTEYTKQIIEKEQQDNQTLIHARESIISAEEKIQKINDLFLNGIVTADNAAYWNAELKIARETLSSAREKYETITQQLSSPTDKLTLPMLLSQLQTWDSILKYRQDFQIARNLILSSVKSICCLADGDDDEDGNETLELTLVMPKGKKWRRERDSNPR